MATFKNPVPYPLLCRRLLFLRREQLGLHEKPEDELEAMNTSKEARTRKALVKERRNVRDAGAEHARLKEALKAAELRLEQALKKEV